MRRRDFLLGVLSVCALPVLDYLPRPALHAAEVVEATIFRIGDRVRVKENVWDFGYAVNTGFNIGGCTGHVKEFLSNYVGPSYNTIGVVFDDATDGRLPSAYKMACLEEGFDKTSLYYFTADEIEKYDGNPLSGFLHAFGSGRG